jgi:hypothetical protein
MAGGGFRAMRPVFFLECAHGWTSLANLGGRNWKAGRFCAEGDVSPRLGEQVSAECCKLPQFSRFPGGNARLGVPPI